MFEDKKDYLRIFIGSPGDVDAERGKTYRVIAEVEEILRIIKDYYPAISIPPLRALGWEQVAPSIGWPNEVVLDRFPIEKSDIFIFLLWRRFGTKQKAQRSDGTVYGSGTLEEFEKAYECSLQSESDPLRPFIMVYQKRDEFQIGNLTPKEIGQYKKVAEFFEDCNPNGKYKVFKQNFLSEGFEPLLRKHLLDAILKLTIREDIANDAIPSSNLFEWLERNKLSDNPFRHGESEKEEYLIKYYVPFKGFEVVFSDILRSTKNWLIFGADGSGKTALKQYVLSKCSPNKPSKTWAISYDVSDFIMTLQGMNTISDMHLYVAKEICKSAFRAIGADEKSIQQISSVKEPTAVLLKSSELLNTIGNVDKILCLLDVNPFLGDHFGSKLIDVLMHLLVIPSGKFSFRLFLPKNSKSKFMRQEEYLGKCEVLEIQWDEKSLIELIKQRMIYFSQDKSNLHQAIGPLCEPKGKMGSIDDGIVKLAENNPRAVMWLANHLFLEHCQGDPVPLKIEARTWDKVQLDWWTTGRNFVLGPAGKTETFFVSGNDIYFNNKPLKLSKRSKALLKRLVDADGQTCSKDELIRTGWPDVSSAGVTEAALREAMRRLKGELKEKNSIDPAWLETQHDQGYRLLEPRSGNHKES